MKPLVAPFSWPGEVFPDLVNLRQPLSFTDLSSQPGCLPGVVMAMLEAGVAYHNSALTVRSKCLLPFS